jgi:hypothetical protein
VDDAVGRGIDADVSPKRRLARLVRLHFSPTEGRETAELIARLAEARRRGYLNRAELLLACRWKAPRAIHLARANSAALVRRQTGRALGTRDERARLAELVALKGVSVAMASTVLTLLYPKRYAVIDIRVWNVLHRAGAVHGNPRGRAFNPENWLAFLSVVRGLARRFRVSPRTIERTLFVAHREGQRGTLYGP